MANGPAPALVLGDGDREKLESWLRSRSVKAGLVKRARIVLLAAEGETNQDIAVRVGASRTTVIEWRNRYLASGVAGLEDRDRSGRPREADHAATVTATLTPPPPPKKLAVTHWSTRLLAGELGVSHKTIQRAWRAYGIKPWKADLDPGSFRFSTDPELVGKVTDICGLYESPWVLRRV
jgi:transposase